MVAALYVRSDSEYKKIPGVDCYDLDRDARTFPGGMPVIAHPPCRLWGRLRGLSTAPIEEKELAIHAIEMVQKYGGVLEHPAYSSLWKFCNLPTPENYKGAEFTLDIDQFWFGYPAVKKTWLYVCGVDYSDIPPVPMRLDAVKYVIDTSSRSKMRRREKFYLPKSKRDYTTPELAAWLAVIARKVSA